MKHVSNQEFNSFSYEFANYPAYLAFSILSIFAFFLFVSGLIDLLKFDQKSNAVAVAVFNISAPFVFLLVFGYLRHCYAPGICRYSDEGIAFKNSRDELIVYLFWSDLNEVRLSSFDGTSFIQFKLIAEHNTEKLVHYSSAILKYSSKDRVFTLTTAYKPRALHLFETLYRRLDTEQLLERAHSSSATNT